MPRYPNPNLLKYLIRSNQGILQQKLSLLDAIQHKHGIEQTTKLFTKVCPIARASIGQHYRHSMDHLELAVLVADASTQSKMENFHVGVGTDVDVDVDVDAQSLKNNMRDADADADSYKSMPVLNYDLRVRGGTLEKDVNEARKRIQSVFDTLQSMKSFEDDKDQNDIITSDAVLASFMLSGDSSGSGDRDAIGQPQQMDYELMSTIGRELGFAAHHAIHHLAMVKIIALHTVGLEETDLPFDFGKAPSTVRFEEEEENRK